VRIVESGDLGCRGWNGSRFCYVVLSRLEDRLRTGRTVVKKISPGAEIFSGEFGVRIAI
jgi:hypothetical protein